MSIITLAIIYPLFLLVVASPKPDRFQILAEMGRFKAFWVSPLYIFLPYQFFSHIPRDLYDAAVVDGASPFEICWRVFIPISAPALATVAILLGIESWNQKLWPLLVTQFNCAKPIAVGIANFFSSPTAPIGTSRWRPRWW